MKIYHYDWNLSARKKLLRRWKFIKIIKIYHWNENVSLWWKIITVMKINHSAEIFLFNIMKIVYFDENFLLWRQFIIKMEIYYCDNWGENILLWCKFLTVLHYKRNKNKITFLETIVVWCIITWMTKNFFLVDNFALYVFSILQSWVPKCSFTTLWGGGISLSLNYLNRVVIDRYGNFHLTDTDTDMLIITYTDTDTDTDMKKTNSPIPIPIRRITNSPIPMPIPIWKIVRYRYRYRYRYCNFLTKLS